MGGRGVGSLVVLYSWCNPDSASAQWSIRYGPSGVGAMEGLTQSVLPG